MTDEVFETPEELEEAIRRDELMEATKLSPREFAQLIGMSPQLVYYHLRNNHIEAEVCICGRKVVDVANAKKALEERRAKRD